VGSIRCCPAWQEAARELTSSNGPFSRILSGCSRVIYRAAETHISIHIYTYMFCACWYGPRLNFSHIYLDTNLEYYKHRLFIKLIVQIETNL